MRLLLYGMQSSGASLLAMLVAQKPDTLAVIDLAHHQVAPPLTDVGGPDILVKCVITAATRLNRHVASFHPDKTVLLLRHPVQNYVALRHKEYANASGGVAEKFRLLEEMYRRRDDLFDTVLIYEDLFTNPAKIIKQLHQLMDWSYAPSDCRRTAKDILAFNQQHSDWCRLNFGRLWQFGKADFRGVGGGKLGVNKRKLLKHVRPEDRQRVAEWAPTLTAWYEAYYAEHIDGRFDLKLAAITERILKSWLGRGVKRLLTPMRRRWWKLTP